MYQESLRNMPGARVVAIYDDGGKLTPTNSSAKAYADLALLLRTEELDIAVVTVANDVGAEVAKSLARARVPFLIDKPVCRTVGEMRSIIEEVRRAGVQCATGYINRFRPTHLKARSIVRSSALGQICFVNAYLFATDVASRGAEHYLFQRDRSGGGVLQWLGCHLIDTVRDLIGEDLLEVKSTTVPSRTSPIDVEELGAITFKFASGGLGAIAAGYVFPHESASPFEQSPKDAKISVWGSRARLDYEPLGEKLMVTRFVPADDEPTVERFTFPLAPEPGYGGPLGRLLITDLCESVREGRDPLVNEQDNLKVLEVLEAAYHVS